MAERDALRAENAQLLVDMRRISDTFSVERDRLLRERANAYFRFTTALVAVLRTKTDPQLIDAILEGLGEELGD